MGKVIVHIGLHKTATTTMQEQVFPNLKGVVFLGRRRSSNTKDGIYSELVRYCFKKQEDVQLKGRVVDGLKEYAKFSDVIISDEWFTSDYDGVYFWSGASWQVKLERLSKVLNVLDSTVLISIRNPVDAVYSYYLEMLGTPNFSFGSFEEFCDSNTVKAYDYAYLERVLKKVGLKDLVWARYEHLSKDSDVFLRDLCAAIGVEAGRVSVGRDYVRVKSSKGLIVNKKSKFVYSLYGLSKYVPVSLKELLKSFKMDVLVRRIFVRKLDVAPMNEQQRTLVWKRFGDYEALDK